MDLRPLTPDDEAILDRFLALHRDSSMFQRANARRAWLTYTGQPFQAIYAAAFRDDEIIGVAAHCWNGLVLVQAAEQTDDVTRACVEWSGRNVTGLSGPLEQVRLARS